MQLSSGTVRLRSTVSLPGSAVRLRQTLFLLFTLLCCLPLVPLGATEVIEADVCVYGATAGGVAAAVQAARMGKTAVIAEFGKHVGGLTSGGLGATDIGNKAAIGGLAREFYHRIAQHYSQPAAWTRENSKDYFTQRGSSQAQAADL